MEDAVSSIKSQILDRIIEEVMKQIKTAERGHATAMEDAKGHKGAMASRYDTFKEEAQYLASGYSSRLLELGKTLGLLKSLKDSPPEITEVSGYALVEMENLDDGTRVKYFLLPAGGGNIYEVDGEEIYVLSANAPMAQAIMGAQPGVEVEVRLGKTRRYRIISVT